MNAQKLLALGALCAILCLAVGLIAQPAHAQDSDAAKSFDKDTANKRGVSESLADGPASEDVVEGPTTLQMAIGIGSVVVMIIVVKWL